MTYVAKEKKNEKLCLRGLYQEQYMAAGSNMSSLQKLRLESEYLSLAFSWGRVVAILCGNVFIRIP